MQCCTTSGLLGAEVVAEPARGLEFDQRLRAPSSPPGRRARPSSSARPAPYHAVVSISPSAARARRIAARRRRARPCRPSRRRRSAPCPSRDASSRSAMIVGEQLDRVGPGRLVGRAMAAAVEGDDRGILGEPLGHRLPELAVHGDRMHQRGAARRRRRRRAACRQMRVPSRVRALPSARVARRRSAFNGTSLDAVGYRPSGMVASKDLAL